MGLRFYNTLTRKKEDFVPLEEGKVGMYVCGITAYDICHIGHARSAIVFDVIYKYLKYKGWAVTYVKNFTDVDDKIIGRANKEKTDIAAISERYIKAHNQDMDMLSVARPTMTPKATENIKGMIRMVSQLIDNGFAYVVDGDVFFSVEHFKEYGKLSGRTLEDAMAGARIEIDEKKRNPLDFVLWKSSKEGEPWWDSPWGRGRPGWHIECSVMSQRYLGETFDIHGGGEDLIFPHHENEIAQSEGASGKLFARYWLHNGFIRVNSEKMSKSLGNFFTIQDVLQQYHPEVVRLFVLQSHYRSYIDFSDESLTEARAGMERFYEMLQKIKELLAGTDDYANVSAKDLSGNDAAVWEKIELLTQRFVEAMDDDINTARSIGYIFDTVRIVNSYIADRNVTPTPEARFLLNGARSSMREVGKVLGLFLEDPDEYFEKDRMREVRKRGLKEEEIAQLIADRREARRTKNWKKADEIRDLLAQKGVVLNDRGTETTWKIG